MSLLLRRAAVIFSSVALICFCSCERHRANELPTEQEHNKSGAPDAHGDGARAGTKPVEPPAHQHEHGASGTSPAASPAGTAAQFFPPSSPSPR